MRIHPLAARLCYTTVHHICDSGSKIILMYILLISLESARFANWFCFVVPGSPHNVETMLESEVFTVSWMEVSIDVNVGDTC